MSFAEQLKQARIAKGLTQQQVADQMGITNSTYCGYETGKRQPDVSKIKQLAVILNTSGDVLLETGISEQIKKSPATENPSTEVKYDPVKNEIIKKIAELSPANLAKLSELIDLFLTAQDKTE